MRNFTARIPLGADKWAFEQVPELAKSAENQMRKIKHLWKPPAHFYHLKSGGHVAAVQSHLTNKYFAKIDLSRFYERVSRNRIIKRLCSLGYALDDATNFAVLSTVWRGKYKADGLKQFVLPYGFVQSALLASLDLSKSRLGSEIQDRIFAGVNVSVYVDDIVISGAKVNIVEEAYIAINKAAAIAGFPVNTEKSSQAQEHVQAFNIDFKHGHMEVCRKRFEEFQEDILMDSDTDKRIALVGYVRSVNKEQARALVDALPNHLECALHLVQ